MRTPFATSAAVNLFLLLALGLAAAQTGNSARQPPPSPTPDLRTIVAKLERAQVENRAGIRGYGVTRHYQLFSTGDQQPKSTVIAHVTFEPPATKSYEIRHASGSSQGEKIVRKVLEHEQQMATDSGDHDFSLQNYSFAYLGEPDLDGVHCYLLKITPKRKDKNLLDGVAWIDARAFLPRRVEGVPSKNPSWWVKKLRVEMDYAPIDGMWLPAASRANAEIRLIGQHTLVGRDLRYEPLERVADARTPQPAGPARPRRRSPARTAAVGVIVPH